MGKETQDYVNAIETPRVKSLSSFDADIEQMQRQAPLFGAELSLQLVELQQAVVEQQNDQAWSHLLNSALQRTQFCISRVDKLNAVLQELRTGLKDLADDQAAVKAKAAEQQ